MAVGYAYVVILVLTSVCKRCILYIMKRTQIQLPDWLFTVAQDVATRKEISLAELVRRGLEYMVSITPAAGTDVSKWQPPTAHPLGSSDPFRVSSWREQLHVRDLKVAEERGEYNAGVAE